MLVVVLLIVLFSLLVIIHEWGHFIAARRGGVGVEEFGVGFPPLLWGKKIKGTLYSINWLPLGGFVRLKGEDTAEKGPGTFGGASFGVKTKILLAGVTMNLLTAVVILYGLCVTALPALGPSFEPSFLKSTYAEPKQLVMLEVVPNSPAAKAGLKRGDFLLEANGQPVPDEKALREFTQKHAGQTVELKYKRDGEVQTASAKLRDKSSDEGFLGVGSQQIYKLRYDPISALAASIYITAALFVATVVGIFQLLLHIPSLLIGLFSPAVPAVAQQASGPLGIFFILQSLSSLGYAYIFVFMANIAVALAAFNVLPLPALDGGRWALIAIQRLTRKHISAETEAKIHTYGFMALLALIAVITVYDLRKPH